MAENKNKRLAEVTALETAEFEIMADILVKKQNAIARLDTKAIQGLVSEELSKMNDIRKLEKDRAEILKSLDVSGKELNDPVSLTKKIGREDSDSYTELHRNFRAAFEKVRKLNDMCQVLLLHSLAFIRQNIRILTDDGKRKLVDKRA